MKLLKFRGARQMGHAPLYFIDYSTQGRQNECPHYVRVGTIMASMQIGQLSLSRGTISYRFLCSTQSFICLNSVLEASYLFFGIKIYGQQYF